MNRAYAILNVKAIDAEKRIITGVATTPEPDRMGDIVEPLGVKFKNPMPLLHQHDAALVVGTVKFDKPTKDGITFTAQMPIIEDPGQLKDRVDLAWSEIKAGLVRAVSIGFRALEYAFIEGTGGIRFITSEVLELSLVTIPANASAEINSIKSFDSAIRAATGKNDDGDRPTRPGAAGKSHKPVNITGQEATKPMKTYREQIAALENKRAADTARMQAIQAEASEAGTTKTQAQREEFDTLAAGIKEIDAELADLRILEKQAVAQATTVNGATQEAGNASRGGQQEQRSVIQVIQPKLIAGARFVRMVSALAEARGNRMEAAQIADKWKDSTPEISAILRMPRDVMRSAVEAGNTTDSTWAGPLVNYQILATEFIDYLRPLTIIGQVQGFRRVPFKIKVPRQTGGATVNWVGEGKIKPVSSLAFDSVSLDFSKIAGIIPLTEELVRLSSPSAEALVRDDLAAAIVQFMDSEFVDPNNAATDVSPASITYGASATVATGTTAAAFRLDAKTMLAGLLASNQQISGGTWLMTQQQAIAFSLMTTSIGAPQFPGITPTGGTLIGFPVVTSENIPNVSGSPADGSPIIFVLPKEVLLADDGGVTIDVSREASLQMNTAPDSPETASTVTINLWQHNMIAIKAERFINWKARRSTCCAYIQGAKYAE
jgi:HK97 family phage major capsid protein/HK97 family phage prohead protease